MNHRQYYFDTFKVSEEDLHKVIAAALSRGGDYSDLYFEYTTYFNLLLKDGVVSSGGFHTDYGVGIRVLKGDKTGYAYSENTEVSDMIKAASAASAIACGGGQAKTYTKVGESIQDLYPVTRSWRECEAGEFLPFLKELEQKVFAKDSRIVKVIARLSDSVSDVLMYNSLGELTFDTRPMGSVTVTAVFQQNGKTENRTASRSFRMGAELIGSNLADELAEEAVKNIDARFEAIRPKGGQMSVVMGAGASGILLHEAMGHAFEADFNRKGQSIFSDKMGKQVCPKGVNVVDDGTVLYNRAFIKKAGTVILLSSVILWLLQNLGVENGSFGMVDDLNHSILAIIGGAISWLFAPLGFGTWQHAVAIVTGLIAKENVVATLSVLYGIGNTGDISALAGYTFLVFNLLCAPCFAAMGAIRREMNSGKWTAFAIGYQTVFAYIVSLCIYQIGSAFTGNLNPIGLAVAIIFVALAIFMLVKPYKDPAKTAKKN